MKTVTRSRVLLRCTAARLVVWAALIGQAGAVAHTALIAHVTCPEHGDLMHVAPPPVAAATAGTAAPVSWPALTAPIAAADDDGHERCILEEDGEHAPAPAAPTVPAPLVAAAPPLRLEAAPPPAARAPLYRLAPKNSPPV